jgi:hypothetical protein
MKNTIMLAMLVSVLVIASIAMVSAAQPISITNGNGNPGDIDTARAPDCTSPQNENQYYPGEQVWIKGSGFDVGTYEWDISGTSKCDKGIIIKDGLVTTDSNGNFCFEAYTVANDDCGVYKVNVGKNKNDNYHVIPEFGTMVGILTALSAVGVFFFVRRK